MHLLSICLLIIACLNTEAKVKVVVQHFDNVFELRLHGQSTIGDVRQAIKKKYKSDFPFGLHQTGEAPVGNLLDNEALLEHLGEHLFLNTVIWNVQNLRPFYELNQIEEIVKFAERNASDLSEFCWFAVRRSKDERCECLSRDQNGVYQYWKYCQLPSEFDHNFVGYLDLFHDLNEHYDDDEIEQIKEWVEKLPWQGNIYFLIRKPGHDEYEYASRDRDGSYRSYRGAAPVWLQEDYEFIGPYDLEIECCVCMDTTSAVYSAKEFDEKFGFCCSHSSNNVCKKCWDRLGGHHKVHGNGKLKCPVCRASRDRIL